MPKLRSRISLSLDGFVAGPNQSVKHPLGVGDDLHVFALTRTIARPGVMHLKFTWAAP